MYTNKFLNTSIPLFSYSTSISEYILFQVLLGINHWMLLIIPPFMWYSWRLARSYGINLTNDMLRQRWYADHHLVFAIKALHACVLSHLRLFAAPWTVAHQAALSTWFSKQEYWSELLYPPPGDLPDPGIKHASPVFPALQVDSLPLEHWVKAQPDLNQVLMVIRGEA